jgi:acetylornithine/succinyldiaminopimelate/putrescine aminotransferase
MKKLNELKGKHKVIKEVRGKGLMIGLELNITCKDIADKCLEKGLLVNCASDNVLRFLPPLIINKKIIDDSVNILDSVLK